MSLGTLEVVNSVSQGSGVTKDTAILTGGNMMPKKEEQKAPTCQQCRFQTNKPSTCNRKGVHVGRKAEICEEFKR